MTEEAKRLDEDEALGWAILILITIAIIIGCTLL